MSAESRTGSKRSTTGREKPAMILKECPVRSWAVPRDNLEDLRKAVVLGIQSAEAGEIHDMSDSLKQEIKVLGRLRRTSRGAVMGMNQRIDPAKIASAIRADRDSR